MSVDGAARRANLVRPRNLARVTMGEVKLFCSRDSIEFAALRGEERQAETVSPPVSAPADFGRSSFVRRGDSAPLNRAPPSLFAMAP
jgi:hypothetical protein